MVQKQIQLPFQGLAGNVVATDVSEEVFMSQYAESHHEWVGGVVLKMSPVSYGHDQLVAYLRRLLETYFALNSIGTVVGDPFVMRLTYKDKSTRRQPDLQIIMPDNPNKLYNTYLDGAADICVEVVTSGSMSTDYGDKLAEYEGAGVGEYWLIDPTRKTAYFYQLDVKDKVYRPAILDDGDYLSPRLPHFRLSVERLWGAPLPDILASVAMVQAMLKDVDLD